MIKAHDFVEAARKMLGVPYSQLDCQAFVEQALAAMGVRKNLPGSNAWYRDVRHCLPIEMIVTEFGTVPEGAVLFIWANDGGEPSKYKADGLGNASHMGICTGKVGDSGAIHSSSSRGQVCYSKFNNRTINGGWNYAGFLQEVDYGDAVEAVLNEDGKDEDVMSNARVVAENGKAVNLRSEASTNSRSLKQLPVGTEIEVLNGAGSEWFAVEYKGTKGFMMRKFVELADEPDDDPVEPENPSNDEDRIADLERRVQRLEDAFGDKLGWG